MTQQTQGPVKSSPDPRDEQGFLELYDRYNRPVYNFFANRGFSREESRDLVQETFLAAYDSRTTFRGNAEPEIWLFGIAANIWRMTVRDSKRLKRTAAVISLDDMTSDDPALEDAVPQENRQLKKCLADEQSQLLGDALNKLPEKMRHCVILRLYEELKYREIADILKVSINTVRSQLFDAREKLRIQLAHHFPDPL
jgi:RNA polymerase sigma factor (sigma-70 family)